MTNHSGVQIIIDGHTESSGAASYNQMLSELRTTAVKNRLVEKFNIPEAGMTTRGFGDNKSLPITKPLKEEL